jgi:hypothetical protein
MDTLRPGQSFLLNNRLWSIRQVEPAEGRCLEIEAIGASEAAQGMTRHLKAIQYGQTLFIEQRRGGYWRADLERDWQETDYGPTLTCRPATELDLLAAHTRWPASGDLKNNFSWSYSRASRYRYCPRAYYYHYYAAWEGWLPDAPQPVKQAYLLKNLTDLSRWTGVLVHDSIKFALSRLKAGQPIAANELISQMHRRAQADFETSWSGQYRQQPNQLAGFAEHHYRTGLTEAAWQTARRNAEHHLQTFISSALYASLRRQSPDTFLDVETLQSFFIGQTKVWVQLDLARYDGQTIYLYDWKTGAVDEAELLQQLAVYGLYARQAWPEWETIPLQGIVYSLTDDRIIEFDLSETVLYEAQTSIQKSITQLKDLLLDQQANLAEMRRFPMINDLSVCQHCQFRTLCGRDR